MNILKGRRHGIPASRAMVVRLGCALLGVFMVALSLSAQTLSEYDVEAAYLYNFGKFVRWPAASEKTSTFDICILGQDPFGGTLEKLIANDKIAGKPIRKRMVESSSDSTGCAIVYISDSESRDLRKIVASLDGGELLVSGLPNFLREGGMIQFVMDGDRVRFEINLDPVTKNHLILSSQLLKVAVRVTGRRQKRAAR